MLAIIGLGTTLLTGCVGKYTGGGFIDSIAGGNQKATFGFNFELIDEDGDGLWDFGPGKVQFQFNDASAGVKLHTTYEFGVILVDDTFTDVLALGFEGPYTSQAGDGSVLVFVTASADGLDSSDDTIRVIVLDGPFAGYENFGTVKKGNIQWHPAK